ncbi:MAG: M23 family metallopeptidase [Gammaproteobacteria bacterium]
MTLTEGVAIQAQETTGWYPITRMLSGSWYEPANPGHGLLLQVMPDSRVGVAWFNYRRGEQIWLTGVGSISNNRAIIPLSILSGGEFPPDFRKDQVQWSSWGTLSLEFSDANHGTVSYQSTLPEFGSGSINLERLTHLADSASFRRSPAADDKRGARPVLESYSAPPSGLGTQPLSHADDMTPAFRSHIEATLAQLALLASATRACRVKSAASIAFAWPVRAADGIADPGIHSITNFVDHDTRTPGFVQDYQCGARSYDTAAGYNHSGVDIAAWPFSWARMDANQIKVVATAPGIIIDKWDGHFDHNTQPNDSEPNAVFLRHDDGSQSWYVHLKKNSLTAKSLGARVERGEVLGIMGSSGNSTGVHLHFEVHDAAGNLIDPFKGDCNDVGLAWQRQPAYLDSKVNRLATALAAPDQPCLDNGICAESDDFQGAQTVYFVSYFRDLIMGQTIQHRLLQPNGGIFASWQNRFEAAPHWQNAYYWQRQSLPAWAPNGVWLYEVSHQNRTYIHPFIVGPRRLVIQPEMSGSWYDPDQSGHGFIIEIILRDGEPYVNLVWFTFEDGKQRWLFGYGKAQGNQAIIPVSVTSGADFPPAFQSADLEWQEWGIWS